jgi:hypothetical protein
MLLNHETNGKNEDKRCSFLFGRVEKTIEGQ